LLMESGRQFDPQLVGAFVEGLNLDHESVALTYQ